MGSANPFYSVKSIPTSLKINIPHPGGEIEHNVKAGYIDMKRCPQCSFLYLDSDQLCDLDQTLLIADDFGTDLGVIEHPEQKAAPLLIAPAVPQRKLNLKVLLAATVGGLIIVVIFLVSYQRIRPILQASQAPPTSAAQSQDSRVSQVAPRGSTEFSAEAALAHQESGSPVEPDDNTSSSAKQLTSKIAKSTPNTRPESARLRVSSNPVSTGNDAKPAPGPVTIRLANGSNLQADEVWRTKAGIWYRRKGIVTLIRPNRVRAMIN